jgi:hypothetical protein
MSRQASLLLRAFAIFTTWVWIVMIRDAIVGSHLSVSFRLIHLAIGIVSVAFSIVTWQIASNARRFTRVVERERKPQVEPKPLVERKTVAHRAGASLGRARSSGQARLPDVSMPASGSLPLDSPD